MSWDLVIRGGVVVDGTGLSRRRADVAVENGCIAAVGHVPGTKNGDVDAERVIDAEGMIVAPGIIDAHTHYDPQLTFDPYATSSCYHGVTTVLAGNCGFSIAPTRAEARPYITAMFAKVEGMAPVALDGVNWDLLDDAELAGNYEGEQMDEIQDALDGNAVEDNGVSLHVVGTEDGHEYLRFDLFEGEPHYHYIERSGEKQTIVDYDRVALGPMLPWALEQIRSRLAPMLEHAGGEALVPKLDARRIEVGKPVGKKVGKKAGKK